MNVLHKCFLVGLFIFPPLASNANMIYGDHWYDPNAASSFDRGMQATRHCGNDPESWVRGSADLDTDTGHLHVSAQLETDSLSAGPTGDIYVTLYDVNHKSLAVVHSPEMSIPGKDPGPARIVNADASIDVAEGIAQQAVGLTVMPYCTGVNDQWGNIFQTAQGVLEMGALVVQYL